MHLILVTSIFRIIKVRVFTVTAGKPDPLGMAKTARDPILVVGGGLGGAAVALALARNGFRVCLIEQAPEFSVIGDVRVLGLAVRWLCAAAIGSTRRNNPS